jgi:Arc/MetJ-type ribon-helix-helix transcriptional regulator
MRTHTYTCNKGYADKYKKREVQWPVPETIAEAIESGEFKDEKTIVRYAVAQLNIRKGHAIQAATVEENEDKTLKFPDLSTKDMEKIARDTRATGDERVRAGGNQKVRAEKFATAKSKAAEVAKTADPAKLALLKELGLLDEAPATAAPAAAKAPATAPAGGNRQPARAGR